MKTATFYGLTALVLFSLFLARPAAAEDALDLSPEKGDHWSVSLDLGYQHQFETDIDDGGDTDVNRSGLRAGFDYIRNRKQAFALRLEYAHHDYSFSGNDGFGPLDPWDEVHEINLTAPMRWKFTPNWSMLLIPSVGTAIESGADAADGVTAGVSAMFVYKVSETFKIGPGVAVSSELEDDASVIPLLYIDWKITDRLRLKTGPGRYLFAAPGVTLTYRTCEKGSLFLAAGMEKLRFRLDDDRVAPEGVGEESSFPVTAGYTYAFAPMAEFCINGGVKLGGEMTIEDRDGDRIREKDFDPAGFVGISLRIRF